MDENDAPQNRSNDDAELSKSSDENVSSKNKMQSNYSKNVCSLCIQKCHLVCVKFHELFLFLLRNKSPSCQF